jgi:uncharacterized heparinase superfamily protein
MSSIKLLLYFNTLKYLSFRQVIFNFIRRFIGKQKIVDISDVKCHQLKLIEPIKYKDKIDNNSVCFLNENRSFDYISDWACLNEPKLWRYNLHYFDFLLDDAATEKIKDKLINDWIFSSHSLKVDAWEPYPVSLRLVNWIKYFVTYKNNAVAEGWLNSLYQQAHILFNSIEYHIDANHYLKNAKALFFAGAYLNCKNSEKWFDKGRKILLEEANEQILDDGGHYEKSPMYHSIFIEDYLDILNLLQANSLGVSERDFLFLKNKTIKALNFLSVIIMPDGDIPLFNDSAFKIAPHPDLIFTYANKLIDYSRPDKALEKNIISLDSSGYYIIKNNRSVCVIDCGSVSPDHQPGHTHCDCLSYELVINSKRVIVNSGLYDYEDSDERKYCRSTKAHNTIAIDGREQSELWGQFRVARRAQVISASLSQSNDGAAIFKGNYAPYWSSKDGVIHAREIKQINNQWIISDNISGLGEHSVKNYIHLHPAVSCKIESSSFFLFDEHNKLAKIAFSDNVDVSITDGWYYPEFGKKIKNTLIELTYTGVLPIKLKYIITLI